MLMACLGLAALAHLAMMACVGVAALARFTLVAGVGGGRGLKAQSPVIVLMTGLWRGLRALRRFGPPLGWRGYLLGWGVMRR